jgi:hypothetical protein
MTAMSCDHGDPIRGEVFSWNCGVYSRLNGKEDLLVALRRPRPGPGCRSAHLVESGAHPAAAHTLLVDSVQEWMVSVKRTAARAILRTNLAGGRRLRGAKNPATHERTGEAFPTKS